MRKSQAIVTLAACFVGVLGALQVDRLTHRTTEPALTANAPYAANLFHTVANTNDIASPTDFRVAAKKVMPSVVSVDRYQRVSRSFFDDEGTVAETGTGSGVIISDKGIIVTNNHVVQGAVEVKVRLPDKRSFTAKVIGTDPISDLAVLKIEAENLQPIELADNIQVDVGEWVLAVGNPLGFDNTVSVGVVSSLKRDLPVGNGGLVNAIQTDAAINPGNSGGALCDAQGHLIGINSAIASSTGQSVGIGFAIPVDRVKTVVGEILKYGYARYAGIPVTFPRDADNALKDPEVQQYVAQQTESQNVPSAGLIVSRSSGAASQAGIKPLDIILAIDDKTVDTNLDWNRVLLSKKPGDEVTVKYWSHGETKTTKLALVEMRSQ